MPINLIVTIFCDECEEELDDDFELTRTVTMGVASWDSRNLEEQLEYYNWSINYDNYGSETITCPKCQGIEAEEEEEN